MDFTSQVERLTQLEREILEALRAMVADLIEDSEANKEAYAGLDALGEEYRQIKLDVRQAFMEEPMALIPEDSSRHVREVVQKVVLGEPLPLEELLAQGPFAGWLENELSMDELDELADEHFHPWYSHYEYVEGMLEAGALVARADSVPYEFGSFLHELRQCYAFQQYLAVCVLCRTAIEIALRHLVKLEGFFEPGTREFGVMRSHYERKARAEGRDFRVPEDYQMQPADMRELLNTVMAFRKHNQPVRDLYADLSRVVHSHDDVPKQKAREYLTRTLRLLHELYEL